MERAIELTGPRVRLIECAPEHHRRLREIHLAPEVRRWWQQPDDDWPAAGEAGVVYYSVFLDGEIIGFAQWHEETDPSYRHAGVDLFLDPAVHGRGLGSETVRVLCAHLVDDHAFHRLVIDPELENEAAIACYAKVGFRPVGVMRRYFRDDDGNLKDGLLMDLLADELVR